MSIPGAMDFIDAIPDLKALGVARLQMLSDQWVRTPLAREFGVNRVPIREHQGVIYFGLELKLTHRVKEGEVYRFPMDDFLIFLIEHGVPNVRRREELQDRIRESTKKYPNVGRRMVLQNENKFSLCLRCKSCGHLLELANSAVRQAAQLDKEKFVCPQCKAAAKYDKSDLFVTPPEKRPFEVGQTVRLDGKHDAVIAELYASGSIKALQLRNAFPVYARNHFAEINATVEQVETADISGKPGQTIRFYDN